MSFEAPLFTIPYSLFNELRNCNSFLRFQLRKMKVIYLCN